MTWFQQWKYRALDILRPVSRERFLKEVATAIAIQTMRYWLLTSAIVVVAATIFHADIRFTLLILCMSCTAQVMIFGCSVWAMRFRSSGLLILIAAGSCVIAATIGVLTFHSGLSPAALLLGPCGMVAVGIAMTVFAYRKWLVTEMD